MRYQVIPKFKQTWMFTGPESAEKDSIQGWIVVDQYENIHFMNTDCSHSYMEIDGLDVGGLIYRLDRIRKFIDLDRQDDADPEDWEPESSHPWEGTWMGGDK